MSNTQYAFLQRDRVPDRDALQKAIDDLGFDLKLDPDYAHFEDEGFLPFTLEGEAGPGFEIYYELSKDIIEDEGERASLAGSRDWCISMVFRGSKKDLACVMIVSCALAASFDAIVSFEGEDPEDLDSMIASTRKIVSDASTEKKPESRGTESTLQQCIESFAGCDGELTMMLGRVLLKTSAGGRLFGGAWRVALGDDQYDSTRYALLRQEQLGILQAAGGTKSAEQRQRLDQIDAELDSAGERDEADAERLENDLTGLGPLRVESSHWDGVRVISCRLAGSTPVMVEWLAAGTSSVDASAPGHGHWSVSIGGVAAL